MMLMSHILLLKFSSICLLQPLSLLTRLQCHNAIHTHCCCWLIVALYICHVLWLLLLQCTVLLSNADTAVAPLLPALLLLLLHLHWCQPVNIALYSLLFSHCHCSQYCTVVSIIMMLSALLICFQSLIVFCFLLFLGPATITAWCTALQSCQCYAISSITAWLPLWYSPAAVIAVVWWCCLQCCYLKVPMTVLIVPTVFPGCCQ